MASFQTERDDATRTMKSKDLNSAEPVELHLSREHLPLSELLPRQSDWSEVKIAGAARLNGDAAKYLPVYELTDSRRMSPWQDDNINKAKIAETDAAGKKGQADAPGAVTAESLDKSKPAPKSKTDSKPDDSGYSRVENKIEGWHVDTGKNEVHVKASDGSLRVFNTAAGGHEVVRESLTRDGKSETWIRGEKQNSGNYTWVSQENPLRTEERRSVSQRDGKLFIEYPDGRKFDSSTSGSEKLENSKEGWSMQSRGGHPVECKYPDGTVRRFTFDKPGDTPSKLEINSVDGSKTIYTRGADGVYSYNFGGAEKKWNADVSVTGNGVYKIVDKDEKGKATTRFLNGLTVTETPDDMLRVERYGSDITAVVRDGKEVRLVRDADKVPVELQDSTSNTSYKKNENGEWVVSALDKNKPFNKPDDLVRKGDVVLSDSGKVSFIASNGTEISQKPGEKGVVVTSLESAVAACLKNDSLTETEKTRWQHNIEQFSSRSDITPKYKAVFQESLVKIAGRSDISEKEKADFYLQLERLLESKSDKVFNSRQRAELADQLAYHAANPQDNAQGQHPNCQVTTIRGMLLYGKPATFASMMTDVITTGNFVTKDGSTIKVPLSSLQAGKGSAESTFPPEDGNRTWLGKISDVTCANIHWQRQKQTPLKDPVTAGQLVYREDPPGSRKDTGARVFNGSEPVKDTGGKFLKNPTLYSNDIADTYQQIAGPADNVILGAKRDPIREGAGVAIVSEDELHALLSRDKGTHIAEIWTGTDWVKDEPKRQQGIEPKKDETYEEHVVLVKDYDPATRTVGVDNSWQAMYDHLEPQRRISLHDLHLAMSGKKN